MTNPAENFSEKIVPAPAQKSVPVRGFMLDVSRGRVPTLSELFAVAELCARLGFNELQLYVEHTFAFAAHEEVWRDASPLLPTEIRALDAFCAARGIELVPNLNSFGHVERWLRHEKYKALAECPNGFFHEIFKTFRAAGTFAAGEESANFMGALYREFLPNFSSKTFNVGGDEPWELGQGRSRELCAQRGKRAVYLEHMARLKARAFAAGSRKIQFWADVLLGDAAEIPADFLRGTVPVIWGYEAGNPFASQCARVRSALEKIAHGNAISGDGAEFYVAPGTSAWLSFGTRQRNAFANIREACDAAKAQGARGVLLTTWGDFGYHNPFSANLFPLIFCAAAARGVPAPESASDFAEILGSALAFPHATALAEPLFAFGKLDDFFAKKITNRSLIREFFFAEPRALPQLADGVSVDETSAALAELGKILSLVEKIPTDANSAGTADANRARTAPDESGAPKNFYALHCARYAPEFRVAAEMALAAVKRADAFLREDAATLSAVEAEICGRLKENFATAWRLRDREGGLAESLSYFPGAR